MALETDLAHQRAEYTALELTLDQTRTTAQGTLKRISKDHATERARLEAAGHRDNVAISQLQEQLKALGEERSDQTPA